MATFSHSRISSFETCKLKYKYHYIDKIETDIKGTIETFMGDKVHRALEKLYKDLKFQKTNTKQDLVDFYNKIWDEEISEEIIVVKEEYEQENYKLMGQKMIEDYFEHYKPFNQAKTIGLETEDYYDLDDKHKIHVRIDRLASPEEGVYEIHDYKTNSNMKTQAEADEDRQLAVYSMGVKKMFPDAKKVKLIWHMLAFDKEVVSERTDEELENLRSEILEEIKQIEQETSYEPTKSGLCAYCEYQKICPLWKHLHEIKDLPEEKISEDEGVRLVEEYAILKDEEKGITQQLEALGEKIRKFADQKGARTVFSPKYALTIWEKEVTKFPGKKDENRKKLIDALKALNLYDQFVDVNNWDLEKGFDDLNEIEKQVLSKLGNKTKISRLYLRKKF